ncbi:glycosyltransferase family 4 protein [Streptococcus suis]|uniref:Glycosyl transferase n=2 Tax=Streptococcus suis TaxID=1307 RepID=A0A0F6UW90_STRSU|nr:glycosyltransferase family 4 protein [Streptococcus suis]AKE79225.1 glycosyl transferase [Streptococcus suis]AKE79250.1 glycosyltransferase [Streptococcus suis]AKE79275.1 glycosyltransferase [Streptococcus suis]AKE79300.1 glycosyltransferase [Streptococcus suis]AKE79363.1 glycosyltransferase [Streptococcus suis]
MKICIISVGVVGLPVPAVRGGAVENLIENYIRFNETEAQDEITVISCDNLEARVDAKQYQFSKFIFLDTSSIKYSITKFIRGGINKCSPFYIGNAFLSQLPDLSGFDTVVVENRPEYGHYIRKKFKGNLILHLHNDLLADNPYVADYSVYDKIISVSDFIAKKSETLQLNVPITTVYNGIDTNRFIHEYSSEELSLLQKDLSVLPDDFVISFFGRINKQKGIMELLKAFLALPDDSNIKLLVVGSSVFGKTELDEFTREIQTLAAQASERVIFTGYIDYRDIPKYHQISDCIVIPSIWDEPAGLTVCEALLSAKNLITTNTGGTPEIVEGSEAVVVASDVNIVENLKSALLHVYLKGKCHSIIEANRARGLYFSINRYGKDFRSALVPKRKE